MLYSGSFYGAMVGADPAWHRRLQRSRQTARAVAQAADACLRYSLQVPSRVLRRLPAAATALDHHGSELPVRVAKLIQEMGADGRQTADGWKVQRSQKKSKEQWASEKEAERRFLANCNWVSCNKGKCRAWLFFKDFKSCVCQSCSCR